MRMGVNDRSGELRNILTGWLRRRVSQRCEDNNGQLQAGNPGRQEPGSANPPLFKNGDSIYERFPMRAQLRGSIVQTYRFEDQYRYVVNFEDGRQAVLFEKELTSAART